MNEWLPHLKRGIKQLAQAGCDQPQLDAELLLSDLLGCERFELHLSKSVCKGAFPVRESPTRSLLEIFQERLARRSEREPISQILGYKEFWSLTLKVTRDVLAPRPETEGLVEKALEYCRAKNPRILDLCTGSGCIAAALATELPQAAFVASDICENALKVARENLDFARDRVVFLQSDLFQKVRGPFDLIVSNPPYLPTSLFESAMPEVSRWEPRFAHDGGKTGLDFVTRILQSAPQFLNEGGLLLMETGPEIEIWKNSSSTEDALSRVA